MVSPEFDRFSRRQLLKSTVASSLLGITSTARRGNGAPQRSERITQENQLPGTRDWLLSQTRIDPTTRYRCPSVEGFCSHTRVRAGERMSFFVSTNPASAYTLEIYRLGYYGGAGGRLMRQIGPFEGRPQPDPPIGVRRLRSCQWPVATELTIPADWLSGVYVGKLTARPAGWQSYVVFIVRDDRPADLLFQCSDHTWQAYNRWPSQFSLYDDGQSEWYWGRGIASQL